jgi:hypothetical protein
MHILGVQAGEGKSVRMKWKVGYTIGGQVKEESGGIEGLPGEF